MYCRNCGGQLTSPSNICNQCGVPSGLGNHYCPNCGHQVSELAVLCVHCNFPLSQPANPYGTMQKSRLIAGLLAILLGNLGIYNFYLGHTTKGVVQLILGTVGGILTFGIGSFAVWIWSLVEGIQLLTGSINYDARGVYLKD